MVGSSTILYKYRGPEKDSILPERPFLIGLHYKGGLYGISMGIHLRTFVYVLVGGPKWQQRTLILRDTVLFLQETPRKNCAGQFREFRSKNQSRRLSRILFLREGFRPQSWTLSVQPSLAAYNPGYLQCKLQPYPRE